MLRDKDIDVVSVCTPNGLHADMSIAALNAGKHVLCEKPMTLTLKEAERVVKANKKSGKKFFLVKQNRYNPPIIALKELFKKGQLGHVFFINATVYWNRNDEYYDEVDWRGTRKMDGGALFTQSSHFLDLMLWLGGEAKSVFAVMKNAAHKNIETEDLGVMIIRFKNGAIGTLQYTTAVYEKNFEGTIGVLGTKGTVKIGGKYINELEYWNVEGVEQPKLETGNPANDYGKYQGSMSNHDKVYKNVVDTLLNGEQIATPAEQGKESVEVMQAAHISAIQGKEIFLPLVGQDHDFDTRKFKGKYHE
jgi:predicted dehydrogenase